MKTRLLTLFCFVLSLSVLSAEEYPRITASSSLANRRTALRCLESASNYAAQENWSAALSQSQMGLNYDDSVSDLWYIYALASSRNGTPKADVIPSIRKALDDSNWVNYNRDNARIFYADLLSDTGRNTEVFDVLDSNPPVFSSSAEYIRAKAYYRIGSEESYSNARNKISNARRIFPDDSRFPLLFFRYEEPDSTDPVVQRLAAAFVQQISQYDEAAPDDDAELEIYAALFASGDTRKKLLESFAARGLVHPLYAKVALQEGMMDQKEAFEYIASFADDSTNIDYMRDFMQLVTDESVKAEAKEYFTAFGGEMTADMTGDGVADLFVTYYRGRPQHISCDCNQDGKEEWEVFCDFGVPVSGILYDASYLNAGEADFTWQSFPALSTFVVKDFSGRKVNIFNLMGEKLLWSPIRMERDEALCAASGAEFFFPLLNTNERQLGKEELALSSSSFTVPSSERENSYITVSVLDGVIQIADYYHDGKLYAHANFSDNIPVSRIVDADGDSVFETTEYYKAVTADNVNVHSEEVERTIMSNLFGTPSNGANFYLYMVQIDTTGDTVPDFAEEYSNDGAVTSSWDTDGDGYWNVRSNITRDKESGKNIETDMFYDERHENIIAVTVEDGVPVKVESGSAEFRVTKDEKYDFYWLGDIGNERLAADAVEFFKNNKTQGLSTVIEKADGRVHIVHVGGFYYGMLVPQIDFATDGEKKNAEKTK